ncbi:hypothetical protein RI129_004657 [Pyrocoelia pectoralis]|uniref:Phenoloxidase-activating factor 2 n=1 Tax=Pyrocoelia pectoralis TaxID=417401 RepID=A0AAN7ZQN5_9COLE
MNEWNIHTPYHTTPATTMYLINHNGVNSRVTPKPVTPINQNFAPTSHFPQWTTPKPFTTFDQNYCNTQQSTTPKPTSTPVVIKIPMNKTQATDCGNRGGYYFNRIIGGAAATEGEFPWQVSIQVDDGRQLHHICGGAILSPHWIITAGHCISQVPISTLSIVAGDHNLYILEGTEQRRSIVNVYTTFFDLATFRNDIALLKVSSPLILKVGSRASAICLPEKYDTFKGLATVSGWGRMSESGNSPHILQQVTLPFIEKYTCRSTYQQVGFSQYLSECQLCAGTPYGGKDACQGDSGGPLVCAKQSGQYFLCGIVSWGIGCARPQYPGVYTEVSCFVDWIKNTTTQN